MSAFTYDNSIKTDYIVITATINDPTETTYNLQVSSNENFSSTSWIFNNIYEPTDPQTLYQYGFLKYRIIIDLDPEKDLSNTIFNNVFNIKFFIRIVHPLTSLPINNYVGSFYLKQSKSFSFAFGSCSRSCPPNCDSENLTPSASNSILYTKLRNKALDGSIKFFIHLGDIHYRDISVNDEQLFHNAFDDVFSSPNQNSCWKDLPMFYMWDDHDYGPNDTDKNNPARSAAMSAFAKRVPRSNRVIKNNQNVVTFADNNSNIAYHSFIKGNVRFIMTDLRSEREPKNILSSTDPLKKVFSDTQKIWFFNEMLEAKKNKQVIIWANTKPWVSSIENGKDDWGGYHAARMEIIDFIARHDLFNSILIISGDMHALAYDDGSSPHNYGRLKVCHAAPLDQEIRVKGGPYTVGPITNGQNGWATQYGIIEIIDDDPSSCNISVVFRGISVNKSFPHEETLEIYEIFSLSKCYESYFGEFYRAPSIIEGIRSCAEPWIGPPSDNIVADINSNCYKNIITYDPWCCPNWENSWCQGYYNGDYGFNTIEDPSWYTSVGEQLFGTESVPGCPPPPQPCSAPLISPNTTVSCLTKKTNTPITWSKVSNATGYRFDISVNSGFTNFYKNYNNLLYTGMDLLNVSPSIGITGLDNNCDNETWYIRMRALCANGLVSSNSNTGILKVPPLPEDQSTQFVIPNNFFQVPYAYVEPHPGYGISSRRNALNAIEPALLNIIVNTGDGERVSTFDDQITGYYCSLVVPLSQFTSSPGGMTALVGGPGYYRTKSLTEVNDVICELTSYPNLSQACSSSNRCVYDHSRTFFCSNPPSNNSQMLKWTLPISKGVGEYFISVFQITGIRSNKLNINMTGRYLLHRGGSPNNWHNNKVNITDGFPYIIGPFDINSAFNWLQMSNLYGAWPPCSPVRNVNYFNISSSGFNLGWSYPLRPLSIGSGNTTVDISTGNTFDAFVNNYSGVVTKDSFFIVTGLAQNTDYLARLRYSNWSSSALSTFISVKTLSTNSSSSSSNDNSIWLTVETSVDNQSYSIVFGGNDVYFNVDWGDGSPIETYSHDRGIEARKTYIFAGTYNIRIFNASFSSNGRILFGTPLAGFYNLAPGERNILKAVSPLPHIPGLVSMEAAFLNQQGLESLPPNLFANNPQITSFKDCFRHQNPVNTLYGQNIPGSLFSNNRNATDFQGCFMNNTSIVSVPTGIFSNNLIAKNFNSVFLNCNAITSVPSDLFKHNIYAEGFAYCFGLNATDLQSSLINTNSYSDLLIQIASNASLRPDRVIFWGGRSKYNINAQTAVQTLLNKGWRIIDGGLSDKTFITMKWGLDWTAESACDSDTEVEAYYFKSEGLNIGSHLYSPEGALDPLAPDEFYMYNNKIYQIDSTNTIIYTGSCTDFVGNQVPHGQGDPHFSMPTQDGNVFMLWDDNKMSSLGKKTLYMSNGPDFQIWYSTSEYTPVPGGTLIEKVWFKEPGAPEELFTAQIGGVYYKTGSLPYGGNYYLRAESQQDFWIDFRCGVSITGINNVSGLGGLVSLVYRRISDANGRATNITDLDPSDSVGPYIDGWSMLGSPYGLTREYFEETNVNSIGIENMETWIRKTGTNGEKVDYYMKDSDGFEIPNGIFDWDPLMDNVSPAMAALTSGDINKLLNDFKV
jgi:hypothetical protein